MVLSHVELIARVAVGTALGGVIGYERDRHKRPVGLRTHMIVAMAAATFMVVSSQFVYFQHYAEGEHVEVDGSRIAASVVSGISFLAGGAILRSGVTIQGLTTAAGLWLVTAIGLCAGSGMYVEGGAVTALGLLTLVSLRRFEDKEDNVIVRRVQVVLAENSEGAGSIVDQLTALGVVVRDVNYEKRLDEKKRIELTFDAIIPASLGTAKIIQVIESSPDVRRLRVDSPS